MENEQLRYLTVNPADEGWGIVVTTIGYQFIPPQGPYPLSTHPEMYNFSPPEKRTLNEYQLIYITKGRGFFSSQSVGQQKIREGYILFLFPGEWHSYYPDPETGWNEYWVGFRGLHIDSRVDNLFFKKEDPILRIGHSSTVIRLYEDILHLAKKEKDGCQHMISSLVLHILGAVYYRWKNWRFEDSFLEDKMLEARQLIKDNIHGTLSQQEIAAKLGLGYSWFRRRFKEQMGISPAQYQLQQKLLRAKGLLTDTFMNISEIAYTLHFENTGQFSTFFKKKEGLTPSQFRKQLRK